MSTTIKPYQFGKRGSLGPAIGRAVANDRPSEAYRLRGDLQAERVHDAIRAGLEENLFRPEHIVALKALLDEVTA